MTWSVAEIAVSGEKGVKPVAGWVQSNFGLDFRPIWPSDWLTPWGAGWCLTHLPTGFAIAGLCMSLPEAQDIAAEVEAMADWSHVDLHNAGFLKRRMRAFFDRLGPRYVPSTDLAPPWVSYSVEVAPPEAVT